ncbi:hypothetical protein [Hominisplanchenecus sp.]|uniref:hypothetical protein n=1 Tax=Hominisplanchenecus sp. TaxID=3038130 RepID=UPI0039944658
MTKTVLIVAAAAVFLVYGFVLWCCIKVGAESEKEYMKLAEREERSSNVINKDKTAVREERAWCDCRMK